MTREEKFNDYEGFVEKFKPKKTTDDCYTLPAVYEAVKAWASLNPWGFCFYAEEIFNTQSSKLIVCKQIRYSDSFIDCGKLQAS